MLIAGIEPHIPITDAPRTVKTLDDVRANYSSLIVCEGQQAPSAGYATVTAAPYFLVETRSLQANDFYHTTEGFVRTRADRRLAAETVVLRRSYRRCACPPGGLHAPPSTEKTANVIIKARGEVTAATVVTPAGEGVCYCEPGNHYVFYPPLPGNFATLRRHTATELSALTAFADAEQPVEEVHASTSETAEAEALPPSHEARHVAAAHEDRAPRARQQAVVRNVTSAGPLAQLVSSKCNAQDARDFCEQVQELFD